MSFHLWFVVSLTRLCALNLHTNTFNKSPGRRTRSDFGLFTVYKASDCRDKKDNSSSVCWEQLEARVALAAFTSCASSQAHWGNKVPPLRNAVRFWRCEESRIKPTLVLLSWLFVLLLLLRSLFLSLLAVHFPLNWDYKPVSHFGMNLNQGVWSD